MIKSYFTIALRSLLRHKTFSVINVFGLAVSMSICLLVITIISDQYSVDRHNPLKDRIYRVNTHTTYLDRGGSYASSPLVLGTELGEGLSSVEDVATLFRTFGGDADVTDKIIPIEGYIVSASMLGMMDFPLLHGERDKALKKPYSIVLTEKTAEKLFNSKDVVGKAISFGEKGDFMVTGVLKKTENKSHIGGFDMLVSASTMPSLEQQGLLRFSDATTNWRSYYTSYVYVLLNEGVSPDDVLPFMNKLAEEKYADDEHLSVNFAMQPLTKINPSSYDLGNEVYFTMPEIAVYALSALALMIMLSACFNYTNLSIARALTRAKEIGVRKVSGAFRNQIFLQFITESVVISFLALIGAFGMLQFLIPAFQSLDPNIQKVMTLSNGANSYLAFVVFSLFVGIVAGLFPAVYMSKLNPTSILKNMSHIKLFSRLNVRKALIVVQFTLSLLFIISATILQTQFKYALNYDLGFDKENVLNIELQGNEFQTVKNTFEQYPEVSEVAGSLYTLGIGRIWMEDMRNPDHPDSTGVTFSFVSQNYLSVLGHELVAGSTFPEAASDSTEQFIIINEYMATSFGYGEGHEAIGEIVKVTDIGDLEIIGVVRNFNYATLGNPIHEFAFRYDPADYDVANLNIQSENIQATLMTLEKAWSKLDPVHEFSYEFYDQQISDAYAGFFIMGKVVGFFAFLAITISCLGLLGMAVYSTESRIKEIGIRKVLGANPGMLVYLLSKGFMRLLMIAVIIAVPLAYFGYDLILSDQAYHAPVTVFDLMFGSIILLAIGLITISSQTLGAARLNPVKTLKAE